MVEAGKGDDPEFKWGKVKGHGGKQREVNFFESFTYDGVEYSLYDSVFLHKEGEPEPFIGKLIKIWENPDKSKKAKVLWYFRPCEIQNFLEGCETLHNELFLASGEGVGLSNVNPLEAVAGKCNVVCISKDSRNQHPSDEELQRAEFVFYRFFDVGQFKILDKIDDIDKIAGIEVKNIFNNLDSQKLGLVKLGLDKKEVSGNITTSNEEVAVSSEQNSQHLIEKPDGKCLDTVVRENADSKPSLGEKPISSIGLKEGSKSNDALHTISSDRTLPQAKVKENGVRKAFLVKQKSSTKLPHGSRADSEMKETTKMDYRRGNVSIEKTILKSKVDSGRDEREVVGVPVGQINDKFSEKEKYGGSSKVSNTKIKNDVQNRKTYDDVGQINKGFVEDKASEKEKYGGSSKVSNTKIKNDMQNRRTYDDDVKSVAPSSSKDKRKLQQAKDFSDVEKVPSKKLKTDTKPTKLSTDKLRKASSTVSPKEERKLDRHVTEITRQPDVDRSKWFKELTWEERMKTAYEQGKLVVLENLDPSLTSSEVQDIIWHGFKENCTAKMVQKTAYSSPHSGQAFVIFKRKEAAELVVRKLDEGCFLMSNGRPLVGSSRPPCFPEKKPMFYGHHVVDQQRMHMMQREMKDAVSTSHCSQPNNIEYDMAIEWCLLQERADKTWRRLYQRQGEQLSKLKAKLKSKI
ncbi:RNA-binding domain superfamily [Sesbania bispinosa]|nr:RNA-binding domain superfamily [Sesbania bispinosa]